MKNFEEEEKKKAEKLEISSLFSGKIPRRSYLRELNVGIYVLNHDKVHVLSLTTRFVLLFFLD